MRATESSLLQAIAALGILPVQVPIIAQVSVRMIIEAETTRLLSNTMIVGVVGICEGVGVGPALCMVSFWGVEERLSIYSSCSLLHSQAKGDKNRDRDGPHDKSSDGVHGRYARGLDKRMKIFPKESGKGLTKDVRVEKRMTLLLSSKHVVKHTWGDRQRTERERGEGERAKRVGLGHRRDISSYRRMAFP